MSTFSVIDGMVQVPEEQLESLLELFEKTNENHKEVLDQLKISIDEIERLNDEVEKLQEQNRNKDQLLMEQLKVIQDLAKRLKEVIFNPIEQFFNYQF